MVLRNELKLLLMFLLIGCPCCKKLTQVGEPVNTITTIETFGTDATANSAIVGIYSNLLTNYYGNGNLTFDLGMAADELHTFGGISRYETNNLSPSGDISSFWANAYLGIYLSNAAIEALPVSTGVSSALRSQLVGEAKFFRAFYHFYLVNLFGDIPIVTTTAYRINDTLYRSSSSKVYGQIISDLKDAQSALYTDYSISNGERIRVNKSGASALLARVYLYTGDWPNAIIQASAIINNSSLYSLNIDLKQVFVANSSEAILQLQTPNTDPYATLEANQLLPYDSTSNPSYYLTSQLLSAFESGDLRRAAWIDSTNYSGTNYYYPFKYKVRVAAQGNISEYYMIFRLAEQYLIRAEAEAHEMNLSGAIGDLNTLRERARLPDLSSLLNQDQVFEAVAQERRIELFAELGHRWLDLKRTRQADLIIGSLKPTTWKSTDTLFPIPAIELINDANLTQNIGY